MPSNNPKSDSMNNIKISVIMATRDSEKTIARAINSFIDQDYVNKELLVVDGLSSDKTCEIISKYQRNEISLLSEKDAGIYDALNKGIDRSTGDVIGLLHSNDLFASPEVLSTIAESFMDPSLDVVYADVAMFERDDPTVIKRRYNSGQFNPEKLKFGIMPAHPTVYMRRAIFDRYEHYDPTYQIAGDFEFIARVFQEKNLTSLYINKIWVNMQMGGASDGGLKSKYILNKECIRACNALAIKTGWHYMLAKYAMKVREVL